MEKNANKTKNTNESVLLAGKVDFGISGRQPLTPLTPHLSGPVRSGPGHYVSRLTATGP